MTHHLSLWTIYDSPSDFPGKFVVREHRVEPGGALKCCQEATVHESLEQARSAVPPHCTVFPREPNDDPVIVEVWL